MLRWRRWWIGLLCGTLALVALLPWLAAVTPWRNRIVNSALNRPRLLAQSSGASFAWFFPQQLYGLSIADQLHGLDANAEELIFDRTLWQIVFGQSDGAQMTIVRPRVALASSSFDSRVFHGPPSQGRTKNLSVAIKEGQFTIGEQSDSVPAVLVDRMNLQMHIRDEGGRKVFTADAAELLNHEVLTTDMCRQGLHLVNPLLADATEVEGTVSLGLDRLLIPLEPSAKVSQAIELEGHLVLHQVLVGPNPWLKDLLAVVRKMFRLPDVDRILIAEQSRIRFAVRDGRVFHEGLAFGLPRVSEDLQIRTTGWVGLDRTIDLNVEVPIPLSLIRDGPLMRKLSEQPLLLHVGGTLDRPDVGLPPGRGWHDELASRFLDSEADLDGLSLEPIAGALMESVGELLERRRERLAEREQNAQQSTPDDDVLQHSKGATLLERFRGLRERYRQKMGGAPPPSERPVREF